MRLEDIDPPPPDGITEPVTLDYAKTFLRVDGVQDDALIQDLIRSSRMRIEESLRATLITRRRRYESGSVTGQGLFINVSPIQSVDAVYALLSTGEVHPVSLDQLDINLHCTPASVRLKPGARWSASDQTLSMLQIEITSGYGPDGQDVPMPLRQARLLLVAQGFEHRLQTFGARPPGLPLMADALLMPYRTLRL